MKQLLAVLFLLALSFSFTHAQIVDPEKVAKKTRHKTN